MEVVSKVNIDWSRCFLVSELLCLLRFSFLVTYILHITRKGWLDSHRTSCSRTERIVLIVSSVRLDPWNVAQILRW